MGVYAVDEDDSAAAPRLDGVIVFGYPLNPPGGPSRASPDRVSHLLRIRVPTLIVQGTRDNFGGPDAVRRSLAAAGGNPAIAIHPVAGGDHSLSVPRSAGRSQADVDAAVLDVVVDVLSGRPHEAT